MHCPPFLFRQILGTFLRSGLLCTAMQVWAEVCVGAHPAGLGCDHLDGGGWGGVAFIPSSQRPCAGWCLMPMGQGQRGLLIREEPWTLGNPSFEASVALSGLNIWPGPQLIRLLG